MTGRPGQEPGHPFDWEGYVGWLVAETGSLAAVADRLAAERGHSESVESIERALRRLRGRGGASGGVWGERCLRRFGLPDDVQARLRWMGHYHSRFNDLPVSVCLDLLRPWDQSPVRDSADRAWVQLGRASVALRRFERERAAALLDQVRATGAARAEWLLVRAFLEPERSAELLDEAESAIGALPEDDDRACLWARLVDQRGYVLNVVEKDHQAAYALYAALPEAGPPFARVRRHNGMGWSALRLGRRDEAVVHGRAGVEAAGDGGSLRLRVMAMKLLATALGDEEGEAVRVRARAIAQRLEDDVLVKRLR